MSTRIVLRLCLLTLVALLVLPSVTTGQIWIDGTQQSGGVYSNNDDVTTANVYGSGSVINGYNEGYNEGTGSIGTANVYDSGTVINGLTGGTGYITMANVYGGNVRNGFLGSLSGGTGYITTANIYGGNVYNSDSFGTSAFIGTALLDGGTVVNAGQIANLTYASGIYECQDGSIGTLTLAGNSANNTTGRSRHWGNIENLQFADDGSGILTIRENADFVFANPIRPIYFFSNPIHADSVDLTYGNIAIDLTGSISEGAGFSLLDLFKDFFYTDTADVFGTLSSLSIGEQQFFDVGTDWTFTYVDGAWTGSVGSSVPEPATLALVALGLAGLGLARRRRK